jgi:hypothetical protein
MSARAARLFLGLGIFVLPFLAAGSLHAQSLPSTLTGTVSGPSKSVIANAKVTVKSMAINQSISTETDPSGVYTVPNLSPGDYEISVSANGFNPLTMKVTLAAGARHATDLELTPTISLSSLGFSTSQVEGNPKEQALLNKRSQMLQIHQKLGLITFFPMVASLAAATQAGGRHNTGSVGRNVHMALGSATAGLYFATAYYAIFAPKVPGVESRGPIRFHKAMAWIHGPGMILTPILGAMADSQASQGERLHGIAKYHAQVAVITAVAYGLALLSETKPNWIPGLGHHVAALFPFHHHGAVLSASNHAKVLNGGLTSAQTGRAN